MFYTNDITEKEINLVYLYFDSKGTLLETINDEALRQYNVGVNTVNVFIEDADNPDSGKIAKNIYSLKYWFQLADGEVLNEDYSVTRDNNLVTKTVPFDRNRDLKHFQYGKVYEFFVIEVPCGRLSELANADKTTVEYVSEGDVFKRGGTVLMTIQAGKVAVADSTVISNWLSLERVAFTVEDAVLLPDGAVNSSEFNWLLQQYILGDYLRPQLVYGQIDKKASEDAFVKDGTVFSMQLNASEFNRMPKKDESFLYFYELEDTSQDYAVMATVANISDDEIVSAQFDSTTAICFTGNAGSTGLEYAICQTKLVFNVDPKINYFYDLSEQGELLYNRSVSQYDKIIYFWENSVSGDTFLIIGHIGGDSTIKAPLYVYAVLATRGAAPNINISASVDNNVGTPSAEVTKSGTDSNPTFAFDFKNLKGETGKTPFITMEATIDDNVGTPSVEITKSTSIDYPKFTLAFKNLKGQRGDNGTTPHVRATASVDDNTGTPSVKVSNFIDGDYPDGRVFDFAFKNLKGEVGNTPDINMSAFVEDSTGYPSVTVTKSGTVENPSFNLSFKGLKGRQGDIGETPNITMSATVDNNVGTPSVTVTKSGTTSAPKFALAFKNVKGQQGEKGIGINSARVTETRTTEEDTITSVVFLKTDGTATDPIDITAKNSIDTNIVSFSIVAKVSSWAQNRTYQEYGYNYSAELTCPDSIRQNVVYNINTYVPEVIPANVADIYSGNFAPFVETWGADIFGIRIYAKKIPTENKTFSVVLTHIMA